MAEEWIKWVKGLSRRREVLAMARALNKDPKIIACTCMEVWEWADENTVDGVVTGVTAGDIDRQAGIRRFAQAMKEVGWLTIGDGCVEFPNWGRHNGECAKKRATERERKRQERSVKGDEGAESVRDLSAICPDFVREKADKKRTREEKRREEKKESPVQPTPTARNSPPALTGAGRESDGGTGGRGEESFVGGSGWTGHNDAPPRWDSEGDRRIEIREYLDTIGVRGPAQTEIAEAGVDVDRLEAIWQAVCADPGATKKHGVFVSQVRRIYGGGSRLDGLPHEQAASLRRIEEIRRTHRKTGNGAGR